MSTTDIPIKTSNKSRSTTKDKMIKGSGTTTGSLERKALWDEQTMIRKQIDDIQAKLTLLGGQITEESLANMVQLTVADMMKTKIPSIEDLTGTGAKSGYTYPQDIASCKHPQQLRDR